MRTVKELSDITDISVRTLHYYDHYEITAHAGETSSSHSLVVE